MDEQEQEQDLQKGVVEAVRARIASPFIGTFVIAFGVHNWQFFYTLSRVAGSTPADSIRAATAWLGSGPWFWLGPLMFAAGYALFWEYVAIPLHLMKRWGENCRLNLLSALTDRTLKLPEHAVLKHPRLLEMKRRDEVLIGLCRTAWAAHAIARSAEPRLTFVTSAQNASEVEHPSLFVVKKGNPFAGAVAWVARFQTEVEVFCSVATLGPSLICCVPNGGLVPCKWEGTLQRFDFVDGRVEPGVPGTEPKGPYIDRIDNAWGVFHLGLNVRGAAVRKAKRVKDGKEAAP